MAPTSTGLDAADLGLLAVLKTQARVEIDELSRRLGLSGHRIRLRMRRLEREGLIRGYHAVAAAPETMPGRVLAMLRFTGGQRPGCDDLRKLCGVRQVFTLCSTWDFMIELSDGGSGMLGDSTRDRGAVQLLGAQAEFELLTVAREHDGSPRSSRDPRRAAPWLAVTHPAGRA